MKGIIGAISGDIIGSTRENYPIKTKEFVLFPYGSTFTDDTVLTLAIADWLIGNRNSRQYLVDTVQDYGNRYPNAGYGARFINWLLESSPKPYGSWANGSAMRVAPCAWVADSLEQTQKLAELSAIISHDHPEGIKGAKSTADAIYLARTGSTKDEIKSHIEETYQYDLSRRLDDIRPGYKFDISCAGSVPESIICFLEAEDFEDTIRNAVSLGGDADTQAAIAGSIASAYWDVPDDIYETTLDYLDDTLLRVYRDFEEKFIKPNI